MTIWVLINSLYTVHIHTYVSSMHSNGCLRRVKPRIEYQPINSVSLVCLSLCSFRCSMRSYYALYMFIYHFTSTFHTKQVKKKLCGFYPIRRLLETRKFNHSHRIKLSDGVCENKPFDIIAFEKCVTIIKKKLYFSTLPTPRLAEKFKRKKLY